MVNQSQNSLGTAMRMWATYSLGFRSIVIIVFDLFFSLKLNELIFFVGLKCIKNGIQLTFRIKITQNLSKL